LPEGDGPDPGRRYRTAIDLADDLRRFLDGKPTLARPLNWFGRAARWLRRNDQAVALATLALVAVFFFSLWAWGLYDTRPEPGEDAAALAAEEARVRAEHQREYTRNVREAFLAWRAGDTRGAAEALEAARRQARSTSEPADLALEYLARLVAGERLHIVCPNGAVTALAVSPDGDRLASGHADGTLALWNRTTGERLGAVVAHDREVTHVAFALGGARLVTVGGALTRTGLGWAVGPAGQITPAPGPHRIIGENVNCLTVSPDGNIVYAGTLTGALLKVHLPDGPDNRPTTRRGSTRSRPWPCRPTESAFWSAPPPARSWGSPRT
jgi:eukaryotic-like serine/threonine-protein kinase